MRTTNVFLIGPTGAGKTTIGRVLARLLQRTFYDLDQEIEKQCGVDIDWIFSLEGEAGFRQREQRVLSKLVHLSNIVLATGAGVILSECNRRLLRHQSIVIHLDVPLEQQIQRLTHDRRRPLLQQKENLVATLKQMREEREGWYQALADHTFVIDGHCGSRKIAEDIVHTIMSRGDL